jgi:putative peptidoglycan lipid II flippase
LLAAIRSYIGPGTASAALVSLLGAASKALGLIRELLLAWAFGTSAVIDAFRVGLTYTTYFSHLFFGEAMTGVLVPMLARLRGTREEHLDTKQLKAGITVAALVVTLPVSLVFLFTPDVVVGLLTPGLGPQARASASAFLRVFGLAIPLYSLSAVAVMVRQAAGNFAPLGLRPVGQNLFLIGGVLTAAVLQKPILIPVSFVIYYGLLLATLDRGDLLASLTVGARAAASGLRLVVTRWFPLAAGLMVLRSNALVERYFGSELPTGSIAALDYARTITDLPLLLLGVPAGAVLLTNLSRAHDSRLPARLRRKLAFLAMLAIVWSVIVVVLAEPITVLVFQRGAFDVTSVMATSNAVRGLGAGAWAIVFSHVMIQYLMATAPPWAVIFPAGISLTTNVILASLLVPSLGLLGLGLSTSGAALAFGVSAIIGAWMRGRPRAPR